MRTVLLAAALLSAPALADPAVQGPPSQDRPADDGYTVPYDRFTLRPGETLRQMDARYRRDFQRARIAGWVLAAADIAITQRCLDRGTCHEGNPIYGSHPSLGRMLAIRVPLEALIDFGARRLFRHDPEQAITMLRVKAGVTGVVVGMNLRF